MHELIEEVANGLKVADAKNQLIVVESRLRKLEHNTQEVTFNKLQDNYNRQVQIKQLRYLKADLLFLIHTL